MRSQAISWAGFFVTSLARLLVDILKLLLIAEKRARNFSKLGDSARWLEKKVGHAAQMAVLLGWQMPNR